MYRFFAAFVACCIGTIAPAELSDEEIRAQVQSERERLTLLLDRITPLIKSIVEDKEGFTTAWVAETFGGVVRLPKGYPESQRDEWEEAAKALEALRTQKPITLEALARYRQAIMEAEMLEATLIPAMLNQIGVALTNVGGETYRYQYTFDDDFWPSGLDSPVVSPAESLDRVAEISDHAAPVFKVEFLFGAVTLEANVPKERQIAAQQRLTDARLELEAIERSVQRSDETIARLTEKLSNKAEELAAQFRARVAELKPGSEAAENERRYFQIEMRTLTGPLEDAQTVRFATLKDELAPQQKRVLEAEQGVAKLRYDGIPDVLKIETDHALLEAAKDQTTELEQVEAALLALNHAGVTLAQARVVANEKLEEAVAAADAANDDLSLASGSSYVLQALTQALVQIADNAIASEGNGYVFFATSVVQMGSNVFWSKPTYYDAELDPDGKPTTQAQANRRNLAKAVGESAVITLAKSGTGAFVEQFSKMGNVAEPTIQEALEHGATRRALGRKLGKTLSELGKRRSQNIVYGVMEGLVLDELTESAKQKIAREVTEDELRTYAAAQLQVAEAVSAHKLINLLEDRDAAAAAALRKRRAELLEERARLLPGQERLRPALRYVRNELFEIAAGQHISVTLSNPELRFDLLIAGVPAVSGTVPGRFTVGADVIEKLGEGARMRLPLTIRLR